MRKIESIILSAGESSRMGKDKALLHIRKKRTVTIILEKLLTFSEKVYIVLGDNFKEVKKAVLKENLPFEKIEFIFNENHHLGMFSSIRKGFSVTSGEYPVLLQMVDQPFIPREIYREIIASLDDEHLIFQPSINLNGKLQAGHPILFSPKFKEIILNFSDNSTLRKVIREYQNKRKFVLVDDKVILQDFNTEQDFKKYLKDSI
ncbi:MAG: NTP transferase domain-containing protein [Candidatus Cloacimonetes bacterium]|nr:NTP transferase domain-containing protein [Candidatus Cloacimonadota bacterium]